MSDIKITHENHICTIELARPDKKNALNKAMYAAMADAIEAARDNADIRAILICGQGDCFTAGNDLADFADSANHEGMGENVRFMRALMQCELPVVAHVHGTAVGIGTTMLLHCDIVVSSEECVFVMPFINLGLVPEYASSLLLPQLAGHRKASKWLMLGEPFSAAEAEQAGIVSEVCRKDQVETRGRSIMAHLVSRPRIAMKHTKALMKRDLQPIMDHMNDELDLFIEHLSSEPAREAFDAFLHKRAPDPARFR